MLDRKGKEFCGYIEQRLDFFYNQTALRLNALSDQIVRRFCESLSQQAAATLNALEIVSEQQGKSALDAECKNALDRFVQQANDFSEARLDAHRKELQILSSNLQLRLKRVAYQLEDIVTIPPPQ